jgi:hypothetical protein
MNFYKVFVNQTLAVECCEWADVKNYLIERGLKFAFVTCGESQWNVRISTDWRLLKSAVRL